jgi:hypothetical protein
MVKKKTKEEIEVNTLNYTALSWCMSNGYKIYPKPMPSCKGRGECNEYKIIIERAGKKRIGEKVYSYIECQNKIWKIYDTLYSKQKDKTH